MARVKFNKIKTRSQALTDTSSNTNTVYFPTDNDSVIVNSKEYGEHGVINAKFFGSDLLSAINGALASITNSDSRTIIDCRGFTGSISISSTITITKPCTLLFGNVRITSSAANFFDIQSDNVAIIGAGRHTDRSVVNSKDNATVFSMTGTGATLTNDSDKGYHIYSKGNKNLRFEYFTLVGVRTTLGNQCGNASYPINGCGGIHIDKANPIETGSGNTCNNIIINQILIDGTKVHGIYISTPILTKISNVRLSQVAGHGIFLNGGTSVNLDNVYVASANLAGFCILGVTYCTLLNTVAEYVGMGYLIRGSFNVSIFSPGVEQTMNQTTNPWSSSQAISGKYGFNVQVTGTSGGSAATAIIPDVTSDFYNQFCGIPYYIQGGRNITLYTPYSTGICATNNYKGNANPAAPSRTCQLKIIGNARNVKVINLYGASINDNSGSIHNDIKIEGLSGSNPSCVEIDFNTGTSLISNEWTKHITDVSADYAPVYNEGENVLIKNAGEIYYNDYGDDIVNVSYDSGTKNLIFTKEDGSTITIDTLQFGNGGVIENVKIDEVIAFTTARNWYVGNFTNYGHQIYLCIENCPSGTNFSTDYFQKVADQDITGTCLVMEFALSPSGTKYVFLDIDDIFDPDDYVKQTDLNNTPDKDTLGYPTFTTTDEWDAGDIVFYNRKLYKFTTAHIGEWIDSDVELFDVKSALEDAASAAKLEELEDKAVMTGSYDATVAVGLADNLRGDTIIDAEFYKRKTGGTQSVGSGIAAIKEVRGKSIVWNQYYSKNKIIAYQCTYELDGDIITMTNNNVDGEHSVSINGNIISGRKYYLKFKIENLDDFQKTLIIGFAPSGGGAFTQHVTLNGNETRTFKYFVTASNDFNRCIGVREQSANGRLKWIGQSIDLTLMFGAGNEPATVEEFEKMFPLDYYDYNTGEVIPFAGQNLVTTGFNQWDEEWEVGGINLQTGEETVRNDCIRSKNYIKVVSGEDYYITYPSTHLHLIQYDANYNFISTKIEAQYGVLVLSDITCYVRFYIYGITTYNNDICINISNENKNGTYEPYEKHTLPLDPSQWRDKQGNLVFPYGGMHGVGTAYDYAKVDADGYIRKVVRCFGQVDLGSLNWNYVINSGYSYFQVGISDVQPFAAREYANIICAKYTTRKASVDCGNETGISSYSLGGITYIRVFDSSYTDAATFKTAMNGVMLYYELAEPIEVELATPIYAKYLVDKDGTEEITPVNGATPYTTMANLSILYAMDARGEIKNLPKNYLSKESAENMLNAMVSAGIIQSYTMTYDTANARYAFTIVAPTQSNE